MSEYGWIRLHRKIREGPFWTEKPFDKSRAWIDIILSANHEPNNFLLGNEMVSVDRGSFITSEKKLIERWGWSKSKVRYFLFALEKQSMIVKTTDTKKTVLKVLNYSTYQDSQRSDYVPVTFDLRSDYAQKKTTLEAHDSYITGVSETAKEPQKNRKRTAKEPQKNTNNNEKNDKKEKKLVYAEKVYLLEAEYQTLIAKYDETDTKAMIEKLNYYKMSRGKEYDSDYGAINSWVAKEILKQKATVNKPRVIRM